MAHPIEFNECGKDQAARIEIFSLFKRPPNNVEVSECGTCRKRGRVWRKTLIVLVGQSKLHRKFLHRTDSGAIRWVVKTNQ